MEEERTWSSEAAQRVVNLFVALRQTDGNRCSEITSYCSVDLAHAASCWIPLYASINVSYEQCLGHQCYLPQKLKMTIAHCCLHILFVYKPNATETKGVTLGAALTS